MKKLQLSIATLTSVVYLAGCSATNTHFSKKKSISVSYRG